MRPPTKTVVATVHDPVYVPGVNPLGFTLTVTVPGVVPEDGLTLSHVPPLTDAENGTDPRFDVTDAVTAPGSVLPI